MSGKEVEMKWNCVCNNNFCFCWTTNKKNLQLVGNEFLKRREEIENIVKKGGFQQQQQRQQQKLICNEILPNSPY